MNDESAGPPTKILLLTHPVPAGLFAEALRRVAPDVEILEFDPSLDDAALAGVEVVLGWRLPDGLASRMPRLRWVCSIAAGVEKLLASDLPPEVPVSRIVDTEQAEQIAQYVVLMALRHARRLERCEALQRARRWERDELLPGAPCRTVVLGIGTMGGASLRLLRAVGIDATGWSRGSAEGLHEVLGAADIVVCALPLTPATEGILDARAFAAMKPGAYLVNIARGGHVVEADLIAAVRSGRLAGAALDVQRREPMPADDPLWDVPGLTITPHVAAQSSQSTVAAQFLLGLRRLQRGEPPGQEVDRARGY